MVGGTQAPWFRVYLAGVENPRPGYTGVSLNDSPGDVQADDP